MASNNLLAGEGFRDDIELREHEQANYLKTFHADNVIVGPWRLEFHRSVESTLSWDASSTLGRHLELEVLREKSGEPAGVPGMTMSGATHYREAGEREQPKKAKGPKLDPAPNAPEPKKADFTFPMNGHHKEASHIFIYRNGDGTVHSVAARWDFPNRPKECRSYYWADGKGRAAGWVQGHHPHPVLYRLPEVLAGVAEGKEIVFLEGEPDVEGAIKRGLEDKGYTFTTTQNGAVHTANWRPWENVDYSPVAGADTILVPDPGADGLAYGKGVACCIVAAGGAVRKGTIPEGWTNGRGKGWGFKDKLPANATDEDVLRILTGAVPLEEWHSGESLTDWETDKDGKRYLNEHNALVAIAREGVTFQYDEFAYQELIIGFEGYGPSMTDIDETALRLRIWAKYKLKFTREDFRDFVRVAAFKNKTHPVREYLARIQPTWDKKPRLDKWLINYLGAEDTLANRFIGRAFLIALARRARQPGVKFDTMPIFEGIQDLGKSSTLRALCPDPEWFTDNFSFNHKSGREDITQSQGKWIIEIPELSGMTKSDVEHMKAMLSRQRDECDLKYEKRATRRGRQAAFCGTTNKHAYLFDETGNRRFWPVKCGDKISLEGIIRDRDQLWAEAAHYEAAGERIYAYTDEVKQALADIQDTRQERDEWEPVIYKKLIEISQGCTAKGNRVQTILSTVKDSLGILNHDFDKPKCPSKNFLSHMNLL
jgi:Virulence-associated protein E